MSRTCCLLLIGFILLQIPQTLNAQRKLENFVEFKIGELDPEDTDSGNIFGIAIGTGIDDRLYGGFEVNYFRTNYRQATEVVDSVSGGGVVRTEKVQLDYTTTYIALLASMYYELRLGGTSPFYYRASASVGWEFIWNRENNFEAGVSRTRNFNAPGFKLSTGIGIRISSTGILFGDILYNGVSAKTDTGTTDTGLPVFQEINLSGLGFWVGINLYRFKIF